MSCTRLKCRPSTTLHSSHPDRFIIVIKQTRFKTRLIQPHEVLLNFNRRVWRTKKTAEQLRILLLGSFEVICFSTRPLFSVSRDLNLATFFWGADRSFVRKIDCRSRTYASWILRPVSMNFRTSKNVHNRKTQCIVSVTNP